MKTRNNRYKTLHGLNGYLFLTNDSNRELEQHFTDFKFNINILDNVCKYIQINTTKYKNYIIIIIPDKSVIYPEFLPNYDISKIKRYSIDYIKQQVGSLVIDLYDFFMNHKKAGIQIFHKTDTHITPFMALLLVKYLLNKIDNTIELKNFDLKEIAFNGDLSSVINNGNRHYTPETTLVPIHNMIYTIKYFMYKDNKLTEIRIHNYWSPDIDRRNIVIHLQNPHILISNNHKILLFGSSFSYSLKDMYILYVHDVYFIYNKVIDDLIELLSPTYIVNERVERGLNR